MHETFVYIALVWATILLAASVPAVFRAGDNLVRIIAADTFMFVVIIWLFVYAILETSARTLDVILVLALLAFSATVAAARFHLGERVL